MVLWVVGSILHGGRIELSSGKSVCSWYYGSLDQLTHGVSIELFLVTGETKTVVCAILYVGWCI